MFEDRRYAAKADKDGRGGDEEYEVNLMGKPSGTGTTRKVAMCSDGDSRKMNIDYLRS